MGFKDKDWSSVQKQGIRLRLIVQDQDWRHLADIKTNKKDFPKVLTDVSRRFGVPIREENPKDAVAEELEFLKKRTQW